MITAKNGEIRAEGSVRELLTDTAGIVSAVKSALVNAGTPEMVAFDLLTRTAISIGVHHHRKGLLCPGYKAFDRQTLRRPRSHMGHGQSRGLA